MDLQAQISVPLWTAISGTYNSKNYTHAILEATSYMTALIRERCGIDGDGSALVGQALGGELPKLKLNSLETESDKNVQKGFEQILRGIYTGIRNPRSHDQMTDGKSTADAIICFINYICELISASKEAFTVDSFLSRVFDPEFVPSPRYAELIVAEVPKLRMSDAIIGLYEARNKADVQKFKFLVPAMIKALNPSQFAMFLNAVSEELKITQDERAIRTTLQMLPPELWPSLSEMARLRMEHKLLEELKNARIDKNGKTQGALVTWARTFLKFFTLRNDFADALSEKLFYSDSNERRFVAKFFMPILAEVAHPDQIFSFADALIDCVKEGDESVRSALISWVRHYPVEWQRELVEGLSEYTDIDNPAVIFDDGTPFLSSPSNDPGEEIPF